MSNINYLIDKYGTDIKVDTIDKRAFLDEQKSSRYKKSKLFSSLNTCVILTKQIIEQEAKLEILGKNYLVLETIDVPMVNDEVQYCETGLFEDDFIHTMNFYQQSLNMSGCNLPSAEETPYSTYKARIRTKKPNDYLQYSLQGNKVPTHTITILYQDGVSASDLIHWGDRRFEIISIENIDEQNIFLEINCIEVL